MFLPTRRLLAPRPARRQQVGKFRRKVCEPLGGRTFTRRLAQAEPRRRPTRSLHWLKGAAAAAGRGRVDDAGGELGADDKKDARPPVQLRLPNLGHFSIFARSATCRLLWAPDVVAVQ